MLKQNSAGRSKFVGRFSFSEFLGRALRDLSRHSDISRIMLALAADPSSVRSVISEEMSYADSHKDSGGFVRYCVLRQIEALVKKNPDFYACTAEQRKTTAMEKFHAAEGRCRRANRRLSYFSKHWSRAPFAHQILLDARAIIGDCLGEFDHNVLEECFEHSKFTPGASFLESGQDDLSLYAKLDRGGCITKEARWLLKAYLHRSPNVFSLLRESGKRVRYVRGDRVSCVPKTWDTDRTIAVQPSWNVFLQKGVDEVMRRRLRACGVDLRDQTDNHVPACIGSVDGSYATIDLSSASDTISIEVVRMLLPHSWYSVLDDLRCKEFTADKGRSWSNYSKFSAMGNCFTFPLETLIFWSIAKACCSYTGSSLEMLKVYGDDIVVPRCTSLLLQEALLYAGFEPNVTKSFSTGCFRETCGADFLYGVDVRPVYMKGNPRTVQDVYSLYNRLLMNRIGFSFPETLCYLLSCVERPHKGPAFKLAGDDYWRWYAGKSKSYDKYFISEPPEQREWDYDLMTYSYRLTTTKRVYRKITHVRDAVVLMAMLHGYSSTPRVSNNFRIVQYSTNVYYWPSIAEALTFNKVHQDMRISAWS